MVVDFDRERFEPPLVEMAAAGGMMLRVPAHGMGVGQPAQKGSQLALLFGPQDEVPMVGHDAIAEDADRVPFAGLVDDAEEGFVVAASFEEGQASDRPIEGVINKAAGGLASSAGHGRIVLSTGPTVKQKTVASRFLFVEHKFIHKGGTIGHIEDVAVHPNHEGKGVGSAVVRALFELARHSGCYKVILSCNDQNIAFYSKLGFRRHDNGMRIDLK